MAWTETTRRQYVRKSARYASDLTDREWDLIASFLPKTRRLGRPRKTYLRDVINAHFYIASTGCQWRMLPKDFPPYSTVQGYFYEWRAMSYGRGSTIIWSWKRVSFRAGKPRHRQVLLTAKASKPRKATVFAAMTRARRSKAASAISSLTPLA